MLGAILGEAFLPIDFRALSRFSCVPGGVYFLGDDEGWIRPVDGLASEGDFVFPEGGTVAFFRVLFVGRSPADGVFTADQGGSILFRARTGDGGMDGCRIMAIHVGYGVPTVGLESLGGVVGEPPGDSAVDGDAVVVIKDDEFAEAVKTGQGTDLMGEAFHDASISDDDIGMVVDDGVARAVELRGEHALGHGHPDGVAEPLPQGTRGGLYPIGPAVFGMSGGLGVELTEVPDLFHG